MPFQVPYQNVRFIRKILWPEINGRYLAESDYAPPFFNKSGTRVMIGTIYDSSGGALHRRLHLFEWPSMAVLAADYADLEAIGTATSGSGTPVTLGTAGPDDNTFLTAAIPAPPSISGTYNLHVDVWTASDTSATISHRLLSLDPKAYTLWDFKFDPVRGVGFILTGRRGFVSGGVNSEVVFDVVQFDMAGNYSTIWTKTLRPLAGDYEASVLMEAIGRDCDVIWVDVQDRTVSPFVVERFRLDTVAGTSESHYGLPDVARIPNYHLKDAGGIPFGDGVMVQVSATGGTNLKLDGTQGRKRAQEWGSANLSGTSYHRRFYSPDHESLGFAILSNSTGIDVHEMYLDADLGTVDTCPCQEVAEPEIVVDHDGLLNSSGAQVEPTKIVDRGGSIEGDLLVSQRDIRNMDGTVWATLPTISQTSWGENGVWDDDGVLISTLKSSPPREVAIRKVTPFGQTLWGSVPSTTSFFPINGLVRAPDGRIWAPTASGAIFYIFEPNGGFLTEVNNWGATYTTGSLGAGAGHPGFPQHINQMAFGENGKVYATANDGIWVADLNDFYVHPTYGDTLEFEQILSLNVNTQGNYYINGLAVVDEGIYFSAPWNPSIGSYQLRYVSNDGQYAGSADVHGNVYKDESMVYPDEQYLHDLLMKDCDLYALSPWDATVLKFPCGVLTGWIVGSVGFKSS